MGLSLGIVGLPNVGKSTLFNTLTKSAAAEASNYPFCTIDPNVGVVKVPDDRIQKLATIVNPEKMVPPIVEFFDIAGLVEGASQGEGLGNKFLSNIRETNAIVQVLRVFEDQNISHVYGEIDPKRDVEVIEAELIMADLQTVEKRAYDLERKKKSNDKDILKQNDLIQALKQHLEEENVAISFKVPDDMRDFVRDLHLLTYKPFIYVANISEDMLQNADLKEQLKERTGKLVIPICAKIEFELSQMSETEAAEFLAEYGLEESGLDALIKQGYAVLGLETYFTAGPQEVRGWTFKKGSKAPQAAGVIHTDFEKGFIRAEVAAFDDFVAHNGWQGVKEAGKMRLEGKEYIVQDGDVMFFRFNT